MAKKANIDWTKDLEQILRDTVEVEADSAWKDILVVFIRAVNASTLISNQNKILVGKMTHRALSIRWSKIQTKTSAKPLPEVFEWTDEAVADLLNIYRSKQESFDNLSQTIDNVSLMFRVKYPLFNGTDSAIRNKLTKHLPPEKQMEWNTELSSVLHDCATDVRKELGRLTEKNALSKNEIYRRISDRFCTRTNQNPSFGSIKLQLIRMNALTTCGFFDVEKEQADVEQTVSKNMPQSYRNILRYMEYGKKFRETAMFDALCVMCGDLLYGKVNGGNKFEVLPGMVDSGDLNIEKMFVDLPEHLPYRNPRTGKYYCCRNCHNNPRQNLAKIFNLVGKDAEGNNSLAVIARPPVIEDLRTDFEKSEIALAGLWYHALEKRAYDRHQYSIRMGTSRYGYRNDNSYFRLMNIMISTDDFEASRLRESDKKVNRALLWLKKNNKLYLAFLAHYETLYRYWAKGNPVRIFSDIDFLKDNKAKKIKKLMGDEKISLLVPPDNYTADEEAMYANADNDIVALSHPYKKSAAAIMQGCWVKHSDFYLDAKLFPHLFPYGTGSYVDHKYLRFTRLDWVKWRLMCYDNRFRHDENFLFFQLDKILIDRIYYYGQNVIKTANIKSAQDKTAGAIKIQKSKSYFDQLGARLPSQIPGSRTFWMGKYRKLLALVSEFGSPQFFVTISQNDYAAEMQAVFKTGNEQFQASPHRVFSQTIKAKSTGKPMVNHPIESAINMNRYLRDFIQKFLKSPQHSPFGRNIAYFIRAEYQQRGAVHYHILLWSEKGTYNDETVVMAEMPRSEINPVTGDYDEYCKFLRSLVGKFQIHKCRSQCHTSRRRVRKGKKPKTRKKCRFGFPFALTEVEYQDTEGKRYNYVRRQEEDKLVASYNLEMLLHGFRHHNVAKIGDQFPLDYICKYVSKAEKIANIKLPRKAGQVAKYLWRRLVPLPEAAQILLQLPQCRLSHECLFLPTQIEPRSRVIKQYHHLPKDDNSTDIYYQNLFEKYLNRPNNPLFASLTYRDFYRKYRYICQKVTRIDPKPQNHIDSENETSNSDSSDDEEPIVSRPRRSKQKQPAFVDQLNRPFKQRKTAAITNSEYFYKYGPQQKKWFMQQLMLRVPWVWADLEHLKKISKNLQLLVEECIEYNLLGDSEKDEGLYLLQDAERGGCSRKRLTEYAKILRDQKLLTEEQFGEFETIQSEAYANAIGIGDDSDDEEFASGDEQFARQHIDVDRLDYYTNNFTNSQRSAFDWITNRIASDTKTRVCVTGEAGVGKTFLINSLIAYLQERQPSISFALLATTGVAANNIRGKTIFNFLQMNHMRKCRLMFRTSEAVQIQNTDLIIIDEISMCSRELFDDMRYYLRKFCKAIYRDDDLAFGNRHIIVFGDFAQLPAIDHQIYESNTFGREFRFMVLREIVRQADNNFIKILRKIRVANYDQEVRDFITDRSAEFAHLSTAQQYVDHLIRQKDRSKRPEHYENIMILVPMRVQREEYNLLFIDHIDGEIYTNALNKERREKGNINANEWSPGILAKDTLRKENKEPTEVEAEYFDKILKCAYPKLLKIKVGAKVILTRNYNTETGWVNGTLARVESIQEECIVISKLEDREEKYSVFREEQTHESMTTFFTRVQFPLELAYSLTVHKAQGLTIRHNLYVVLDRVFKNAQPYVSFSRTTDPNNLYILNAKCFNYERIEKSKNTNRSKRLKFLLDWIDEVDVIGKAKNISFPADVVIVDDYNFVFPEDREGNKKFNPGERPPPEMAEELSDIEDLPDIPLPKDFPKYESKMRKLKETESTTRYTRPPIDDFSEAELTSDEEGFDFSSEEESDIENYVTKSTIIPKQNSLPSTPRKSDRTASQRTPVKSKQRDVDSSPDTPRKTRKIADMTSRLAKKLNFESPTSSQTDEPMPALEMRPPATPQPTGPSLSQRQNDVSLHRKYAETARNFLRKLLQQQAYHQDIQHLIKQITPDMQNFARAMLTLVQSYPERLYSREQQANVRALPGMATLYRPVYTTGDGDCMYHAVSLALTGQMNLTPVIRFLTLYKVLDYCRLKKIIQMPNYLREHVDLVDIEALKELSPVEFAFSTGLVTPLGNWTFPPSLQDVVPEKKATFQYGTSVHQYFLSLVLRRPVFNYGHYQLENEVIWRAQKQQAAADANGRPVVAMLIQDSHYTCLLPLRPGVGDQAPYSIGYRMINDEEYDNMLIGLQENPPANYLRSTTYHPIENPQGYVDLE